MESHERQRRDTVARLGTDQPNGGDASTMAELLLNQLRLTKTGTLQIPLSCSVQNLGIGLYGLSCSNGEDSHLDFLVVVTSFQFWNFIFYTNVINRKSFVLLFRKCVFVLALLCCRGPFTICLLIIPACSRFVLRWFLFPWLGFRNIQ